MFYTSIIISIIALVLSMTLGRRNPVKSSGLTAGMVVLLLLVPVLAILPKWEVAWLAGTTGEMTALGEATNLGVLGGDSFGYWGAVVATIWSIGCGYLLFRLGLHIIVIRRWCREAEVTKSIKDLRLLHECAEQIKMDHVPEIRYSENLASPVVTGLLKPILLMPISARQWSSETLKMVIMHEFGHVQRRDLWVSMAAQITCALHWYNPLVWMLRKRLINECEFACDAYVISHGANAKTYITALCDVAESCQVQARLMLGGRSVKSSALVATLAMADSASLKNRVQNVLTGQPRRNSYLVAAILVVSASVTLAYNVLRPESDAYKLGESEGDETTEGYSEDEVRQRLEANPFPVE